MQAMQPQRLAYRIRVVEIGRLGGLSQCWQCDDRDLEPQALNPVMPKFQKQSSVPLPYPLRQ
jgi:hypothetical protein